MSCALKDKSFPSVFFPSALSYLAIGFDFELEGCNNHNLVIDTLFAEVETHGVVIDTQSLW